MKHYTSHVCVALLFAGALLTNSAVAQDKPAANQTKPTSQPAGADMAEMMKKAEAAGKPGAPHTGLQSMVGEWKAEARFWMAPDAPPVASTGTSKVRAIHGGRFVQEEFTGTFMGKPFTGTGITGYDNTKQKFVSIWLDDMSTGMLMTEGTADASGKVFTFEGKMDCAMTGEKNKAVRCILRVESPEKHIFEMHDPSLGEKSRTGEIVYTRK
ncbi:MAG: DUF1579 domain-containing protein [Akkermansiaceae bacterium]|nr:DUF1579 domain-containing protein [Verrucomicrobiales bacterium]